MTPLSVCVLGSSHTAALKHAWTNQLEAQHPGVTMTFFAARQLMLGNLVYMNGSLSPTRDSVREMIMYTSGGKDRIEIADYDVFVLVALGFNVDVTQLSGHFGIAEHQKWGQTGAVISHACFEAVVRAPIESSLSMKLADTIRAVSDRPIFVYPRPFLSEIVLEDEPHASDPRLRDPAYLKPLVALGKNAAIGISKDHGCEVIWQDASTMRLPGFTKAEFGRAPAMLLRDVKNSDVDSHNHMNEDYGVIVLGQLLDRLQELPSKHDLAAHASADRR